jgi:NADP-dependent alcohol dehydrogenase
MVENYYIYFPTKLIVGRGAIDLIRKEIPEDGVVLALVSQSLDPSLSFRVSSIFSGRSGGLLIKRLRSHEPHIRLIKILAKYISKRGVGAVVVVGGGSLIDLAKAALAVTQNPNLEFLRDLDNLHTELSSQIPLYVIPTIPGSGSDFNNASVYSIRPHGEKRHLISRFITPKVSAIDPDFSKKLANQRLLEGLFDCLIHILEQGLARSTHESNLTVELTLSFLRVNHRLAEIQKERALNPVEREDLFILCGYSTSGMINRRRDLKWTGHKIASLAAMDSNIGHARSLALLFPHIFKVLRSKQGYFNDGFINKAEFIVREMHGARWIDLFTYLTERSMMTIGPVTNDDFEMISQNKLLYIGRHHDDVLNEIGLNFRDLEQIFHFTREALCRKLEKS